VHLRRDEGFLVAEVVFSAAIFLFAFTTVMLLTTTSMMMSNRAKQKSTMANAVASYVEQVRALPYNQIGTQGGDPPGVLQPTNSVISGFSVAIVPTVIWYDDPDLAGAEDFKKVDLAVTCSSPGENPKVLSMPTEIFVSVAGSGNNVVLTPPSVGFSYPTTSSGMPVLYGSSQQLAAWAQANGEGVNLTSVYVDCDGVPVQLTDGGTGQYSPSGDSFSQTLLWNTQALDSLGATITPDGMHTLKVEAWDTNSQQGFITMSVLVDNHAPSAPTSVALTDVSSGNSSAMTASWPTALDGLTPADHYLVAQYVQGVGATDPGSLSGWTQNPTTPVSTTGLSSPLTSLQPFSRYMSGVTAASPRGFTSGATGGVGITRSRASGTWLITQSGSGGSKLYTAGVTVVLEQPTFPRASVSNILLRSSSSSMAGATQIGCATSGFVLQDSYSSSKSSSLPCYYYQVVSTVVPLGYPSANNAPVTVRSNVVGPSVTGPTPMTNVGW
jgi:hypothetical protein